MKKLYILHENNDWMEPIRIALNNQGLEYTEWFLAKEGNLDLSIAPPDAIYFNRVSPSSHGRGNKYSVFYTSAVLSWLESYNRTIINGSGTLKLEVSKANQLNVLKSMNILAPNTIAAFSKEDIILASHKIGYPLMLKHNWGGRGMGVRLFLDIIELKQYVYSDDYEESFDGVTLVQQYIKSMEPRIYRAEFVGGKLVYVVAINNEQGYNLCPADSCSLEGQFCATSSTQDKFTILQDFYHPILERYKEFLFKYKIDVAGIEFILDERGEAYTFDVNVNTNYNQAAERKFDISATMYLAGYLHNRCHG